MILLRKNAFSDTSIEVPFKEKESLQELLERTLTSNGYENTEQHLGMFQILVNGLKVEKEFWHISVVMERDSVLIAPIISGGSTGELFKSIAIIAIVITTSVLYPPSATAWGNAFLIAGVSVGATLLLNSLIPPPVPGLGSIGGGTASLEDSQMYTIASQSNGVKKFGGVPAVYGRHRVFPTIAANPYTEIEADPDTGTLVQYFYAIYDFGYGPLDIQDIRIGDTAIANFENADYRLVDLNKPVVSEGVWDDRLFNSFQFYKGDSDRDDTPVALDKDGVDGGPVDDYIVVRNASANVNGNNQEISLDFVAPQGLIAYGSNGATSSRSIELRIEFCKDSENFNTHAKNFNDLTHVYDFKTPGGTIGSSAEKTMEHAPYTSGYYHLWPGTKQPGIYTGNHWLWDFYGYEAGATYVVFKVGSASVGSVITSDGSVVGKVVSVSSEAPGYERYTLAEPCPFAFIVTARFRVYDGAYGPVESDTEVELTATKSKGATGGIVVLTGKTTNSKYFTVKFKPRSIGAYKVRITRVRTTSVQQYQKFDKLSIISVATRFDRAPIITDKRHVFLELRIRATNQLNGSVQNLSAVATSALDVYDANTQTWSKQLTSNPAWVYCDLLTGQINPKALDRNRLHMDSIVEWAEFCDTVPTPPPAKTFVDKRFTCNFVLDYNSTLQQSITTVTNAAQASMNIVDGKYGVLLDKLRTVPVQIFTPRNSWDFKSSRNYSDPPDALKIRYISPNKNWEIEEIVVYDDGFDVNNAEVIDELSSFACTSYEQAWRFGRYMIAQARLRQETISISVDFEHIVCTRGDYVQVSQDVMKVGGRPARVKSVSGNRIKIDDAIDTIPGSYGYVFRSPTLGIYTNTLTVVDSDEFDLDGTMPAVGDLVVIGQVGSIVIDCLVKSISPNDDMSATLILVEKADAIYSAESTDTIPDYDPQFAPAVDSEFAAPAAVENLDVVENTWRVEGGKYEYYMDLDWDLPPGSAVETFEIYVDSGQGYNLVDYTKESFYEYIVNEGNLGIEHFFKVLGVSASGKKINLIDAMVTSDTPIKKVTPPSDVTALYINITGEVLQLDWPQVFDADLREYLLRYTPVVTGATWEASIPMARVDGTTNSISVQGRTGTYFIKAVDLNYNESVTSAQARTSIPNLFDLNVIDETNDFPSLPGELVASVTDGSSLMLQKIVSAGPDNNQYYPEGFYYYSNFLDLGEIYTVRLQSLIEAEGFTVADLMSNWVTLDAVLLMANAGQASWDVETYVRATDQLNTMSEWTQLSLIDPLSEGVQDNWSVWKKFTIGDFTGRIFQFRLRLVSNNVSVTPRVYNGVIKADMPDRFESYNDLTSSVLGTTVTYTPSFKGPGTSPNVQITQDNASQGDYYVISNKTLDGFDITFYDINSVAVVRQFDVAVKGYGRKATAVI